MARLFGVLLLLLLSSPCLAHNGKVALAHPIRGVVVDGDLSDWPAREVHPIRQHLLGQAPRDSADFAAHFRVGFDADANAIYVAIEVLDDVVATAADEVERCELLLDVLHHKRDSPSLVYSIYGSKRQVVDTRAYPVAWQGVEVAHRITARGRAYEWMVSLEQAGLRRAGKSEPLTIGFDIMMMDRDGERPSEGHSWISWGPEARKRRVTERRGDLVLLPPGTPLGSLRARLGLPAGESVAPGWLESDRLPGLRVTPSLDAEGKLSLTLPADAYRLSLRHSSEAGWRERVVELRVEEGQSDEAVVMLEPLAPAAPRVPRSVAAGRGTRRQSWRSFGVADGLAGMTINDITQDGDRNLWFATDNGVSRFDGHEFTSFGAADGLAHDRVNDLLWRSDGVLWIATARGLSSLEKGQLQSYGLADGLAGTRILSLREGADGALLIETDAGWCRHNPQVYAPLIEGGELPEGEVRGLFADRAGRLWLAIGARILRVEGAQQVTLEVDFDELDAVRFAEDPTGAVWAVGGRKAIRFGPTWSGGSDSARILDIDTAITWLVLDWAGRPVVANEDGVWRYADGGVHSLRLWTGQQPRVRALMADRAGGIWVGTEGAGVCHLSPSGTRYFDMTDGLAGSTVMTMYQDAAGDLWFATSGHGVSHFDGAAFTTLTEEDGLLYDWVYAIAQQSDGSMWFGTPNGASRYRGGRFTSFTVWDGLPRNQVESLHADRFGNVWLQTGASLARYDGTEVHDFATESGEREPLRARGVSAVYVTPHGVPWIATVGSGVLRYGGKRFAAAAEGDVHAATQEVQVTREVRALIGDRSVTSVAGRRQDHLWVGTEDGLLRIEATRVTRMGRAEGLAGEHITSLFVDDEGNLWVGTAAAGLSLYDAGQFANLLPGVDVLSVGEDAVGGLWLHAAKGRVVRYDGEQVLTLGASEGVSERVTSLAVRGDEVWVGTAAGEVARWDGSRMRSLGVATGEAVSAIGIAGPGEAWIGTADGQVCRVAATGVTCLGPKGHGGITRILVDGQGRPWLGAADGTVGYRRQGGWQLTRLSTIAVGQGHLHFPIIGLHEDQAGSVWIATAGGGLTRFADERFVTYTTADGLPDLYVTDVIDGDGKDLWFGTLDGVARFDGRAFAGYGLDEGLPHTEVTAVARDARGHTWFATAGGGVARFDGLVFQSLLQRDGLAHDSVNDIHVDARGDLWFATRQGVTRYRPQTTVPSVVIRDVARSGSAGDVRLADPDVVEIEFGGVSFRTRPEQMAYAYRLDPLEAEWRWTRETSVSYADLTRGRYRFLVRAVDRDLNYSSPAEVQVVVHLAYGQIVLRTGLGLALVGLVIAGHYGVRRRRERDLARSERDEVRERMLREMEEELQTAHDMQMGLMPAGSPAVVGLSLAGRCVSANHVGGDFYQYFEPDGGITVTLADVTGHAMEAAIPAVMFSGILDSQMEQPKPLPELFQGLNRSLCRSLGTHTFVCLAMLDIGPSSRSMRVANCGCPYPLLYRAGTGQIEEIQVEAYPLGIRPDTEYLAKDVSLEPGDYVVLHSDGFSEATNAQEQLFGFDRTMEVILQGCSEGLSPEDLIDRLTGEVRAFTGDEPQADDMTCVVIRMEA